MKKAILTVWIVGVLVQLFQCTENKKFVIKGSFKIPDPTPVQLFYLTEQGKQLVDSVYTSTGEFILQGPIDRSGIFLMKFFNDQSIFLVIHPGDKITVDIDNTGEKISYYVENSPDSKRIKELTDKQNIVIKQIDELSREWELHKTDTVIRKKIDAEYARLMVEHKQYSRDFIHKNPRSLANILALYQNFGRKSQPLFDKYDDLDLFNFVDSMLVPIYPETDAVRSLNREVNQTKEEVKHNRYIEKIIREGVLLPAFVYPDIDGDTVKAGFTQNKPALLYFWATWNPYSVKELISINDFANHSNRNGIIIITVSLDTSEKKLRTFLSANNIKLPVVCDYSFWDSDLIGRYAIKRIPASIVSNRQGMIVSIDIFDQELFTRLNDLNR
jgi:peroxiredoxin